MKRFKDMTFGEQLEQTVFLSWEQMTKSTDSTLFTLLHIGILTHQDAKKLRQELAMVSRYIPQMRSDISLREAWKLTRQTLVELFKPRIERTIKDEHICRIILDMLQQQVVTSDTTYNRRFQKFEIFLRDGKVQQAREFFAICAFIAAILMFAAAVVTRQEIGTALYYYGVLLGLIWFILGHALERPWINK